MNEEQEDVRNEISGGVVNGPAVQARGIHGGLGRQSAVRPAQMPGTQPVVYTEAALTRSRSTDP